MNKPNPFCKLADKFYRFNFVCKNCPKRVDPSNELKKKGLTCAYQKQGLAGYTDSEKVTYTENGIPIKYFEGVKHYWNVHLKGWLIVRKKRRR